ncbi:MAG: hypothetical protein ABI690_15005 [Chloroflexota bacterium]
MTSAEAQNDKNDESETAKVVVFAGFYEHLGDKDDHKHCERVFIFIVVSPIAIQSLCHHFEAKGETFVRTFVSPLREGWLENG